MHTHERAREHTLPLVAHTSSAHAADPRGDHREEPQARPWQSRPTRPCKGLRNRRRLQPAPPSPGRVQREAGGGKGVCPRPLLRWEQRVWEGRGPGGGAQAPIKSPYGTDINKPCQATLSRCGQIVHPSSSLSAPPAGSCTFNLVVGSFPCLLAH